MQRSLLKEDTNMFIWYNWIHTKHAQIWTEGLYVMKYNYNDHAFKVKQTRHKQGGSCINIPMYHFDQCFFGGS